MTTPLTCASCGKPGALEARPKSTTNIYLDQPLCRNCQERRRSRIIRERRKSSIKRRRLMQELENS
jgi:hypothetical protein